MSDNNFEELEEDFGDVMALLREGPHEMPTETPSEAVWTAIAVGVGGDVAAAATVLNQSPAEDAYPGPSGLVQDADDHFNASDHAQANGSANGPANNVVSLDDRRSLAKPFAIVTAVAAAVLLVALPLGLAFRGNSPEQRAELLALGDFDGEGQAELIGRTLDLDLEGLDAPEGSFYELWLLDLDGEELVDLRSLGRVEADGSFTVPDEINLDEFSVVDVSIELDDGNPDHSGDSVLRGGLDDA